MSLCACCNTARFHASLFGVPCAPGAAAFPRYNGIQRRGGMPMISEVSVESFLNGLASPSATPGGGSTAAIMGAMGAALVSMVCGLTLGKKGYVEAEEQIKEVLKRAHSLRQRLMAMIEDDLRAYGKVMGAYALPRDTEAGRVNRTEAIQEAMTEATLAPLACARVCGEVMELARIVSE